MEELSDAGSIPARSTKKPLLSLQIVKASSGFPMSDITDINDSLS